MPNDKNNSANLSPDEDYDPHSHGTEAKKLLKKEIDKQKKFWSSTVPNWLNVIVLFLSAGLIGFVSWDTYLGTNYLEDKLYMNYQFIVCLFFLGDIFFRFFVAKHKLRYFFISIPFILISLPYLNIIQFYGLNIEAQHLYFVRFIPIIRGLVALTMVVTYASQNLTTTVCASYLLILITVVYMSGLLFYVEEKAVNPDVKNLWYAVWWAGMNATTLGCNINPETGIGMALGLMLSVFGILMFPLFTVYFGTLLQQYSHKLQKNSEENS